MAVDESRRWTVDRVKREENEEVDSSRELGRTRIKKKKKTFSQNFLHADGA